MTSRAVAPPEDFRAPAVFEVLGRSLWRLALLSIFVGVATFAALTMLAPAMAKKVELSAIAAVASLLFATAWIILISALRAMPRRKSRKPQSVKMHADDLLLEIEEPLLHDVSDTGTPSALKPAPSENLNGLPDSSRGAPSQQTASSPMVADIEALAARVKEHRPSGGGHRTLITSNRQTVSPFPEALELARALAASGAQTIVIDWSPDGDGFASAVGLDNRVGINGLLEGNARFDAIIQRIPGTTAQAIASGSALPNEKIDADLLNLALDALDEVYDNIIVTARHDEARALFECIEGRFDAGITVAPKGESPPTDIDRSVFIGFEVADIDVVHFERSENVPSPVAARIARATRPREVVTRSA